MSNLPKISFHEAAQQLSSICAIIDVTENIDDLLLKEFDDALVDVTKSIDRRKAFYRECESKIEMAKAYRDQVTKHIKQYEKVKERLIEVTKNVVEANPDIPFKDSFGKQLKVMDNPTPKLVVRNPFMATIESEEEKALYWRPRYEVHAEKVKEDLLAGKELSFAHLEFGKQLRGMK